MKKDDRSPLLPMFELRQTIGHVSLLVVRVVQKCLAKHVIFLDRDDCPFRMSNCQTWQSKSMRWNMSSSICSKKP